MRPLNYITNGFSVKSWLLTRDHKRIAVLYLLGVTASVAHLAISAWGYGITAGWFATKQQKKRGAIACVTIGSLLFITSAATVVSMATGMEFASSRKPSATCTPQQK